MYCTVLYCTVLSLNITCITWNTGTFTGTSCNTCNSFFLCYFLSLFVGETVERVLAVLGGFLSRFLHGAGKGGKERVFGLWVACYSAVFLSREFPCSYCGTCIDSNGILKYV